MKQNKNNYIIIGLCAVIALMVAGYAAFASQLTINNTVNVTSSWCVGFDNTKTNTMVKSAGIVGGTLPTGSITYGGVSCGTKTRTVADLSASFKQPGDTIEYTLTIVNEGSLNAKIDSIKIGDSVLISNTTVRKGNVKFTINMPSSTSISAGSSVTMTVIAEFQNDEDITRVYSGENQNISVEINSSQDDGNGGFTPINSFVYAYNTDAKTIGSDVITNGVSNYTQLSSYQSGTNTFLKYGLDGNNVIRKAWACTKFDFIAEPVCLEGGDESYYAANRGIIEGLASIFNSNGGSCSADSSGGSCTVGDIRIYTSASGSVLNYGDYSEQSCSIDEYGASCYDA